MGEKKIGRPKKMPSSFIYFISYEGGPIKIGVAKNPESRLRELQTGCPFPLRVLGTMPGTISLERQLHIKFDHLRLGGEWFSRDREILNFIDIEKERQSSQQYDDEVSGLKAKINNLELSNLHLNSKLIEYQKRVSANEIKILEKLLKEQSDVLINEVDRTVEWILEIIFNIRDKAWVCFDILTDKKIIHPAEANCVAESISHALEYALNITSGKAANLLSNRDMSAERLTAERTDAVKTLLNHILSRSVDDSDYLNFKKLCGDVSKIIDSRVVDGKEKTA